MLQDVGGLRGLMPTRTAPRAINMSAPQAIASQFWLKAIPKAARVAPPITNATIGTAQQTSQAPAKPRTTQSGLIFLPGVCSRVIARGPSAGVRLAAT